MGKIFINISIDGDKNVIIYNSIADKKMVIDYKDKVIKAQDVYDVLDYRKDNEYEIKSETSNLRETDKDYYDDIFKLFNDICEEINKLSFKDDKSDNKEE